LLDQVGLSPNETENKESPLHRAIFRNDETILKELLERGADSEHLVPLPGPKITPAQYTVIRKAPILLDMLLENGAGMQDLEQRINEHC
jgi:hypothetical protein